MLLFSPEQNFTDEDSLWLSDTVRSGLIPDYVGKIMLKHAELGAPTLVQEGIASGTSTLLDVNYADVDAFEDTLLEAMGYDGSDLPAQEC